MEQITSARLGWLPDVPDHRDHFYSVCAQRSLPPRIDLRPHCPPIWDQGELGSCTAHAIIAAVLYDAIKTGQTDANVMLSRLFLYFNERAIENTVASDAGAMIRDGIKSVVAQGVCEEKLWWYNPAKFTVKPNKSCYTNALKYKALTYARVPVVLSSMKTVLADGFPFVAGVTCYDSFLSQQTARTGHVPMPGLHETMQGGHAILIVGYDDDTQEFVFRNSWSDKWGDKGYGYLPYSYLSNPNLADDAWAIKSVM